MVTRRQLLLGAAVSAWAGVARAAARPFAAADFAAAQAEDKAILIDVTASWCPTCRAQKPILASLLGEARFAEFVLFEVDYDRQKDVVRRFAVRMQSTLIVFRGQDELGRSVGDTNRASILSLLEMAL
jgi:thioredoxin 1